MWSFLISPKNFPLRKLTANFANFNVPQKCLQHISWKIWSQLCMNYCCKVTCSDNVFILTENICLQPQDRMLREDICSIIERHVKDIYPGKVYMWHTYVFTCHLIMLQMLS